MKQLFVLLIGVMFLCSNSLSQTNSILTIEDFRAIVLQHHPVAYQIGLLQEFGENTVLTAKGGFDPKLDAHAFQKYLSGKQYYSFLGGKIKVPTWFGIELEAGYNLNDGAQLNPESYTDPSGLWNAGVSINLGKGLLLDQRRADLLQAKVIRESSELEKQLALNQLRFDAEITYWNWSKAHLKYQLVEESVERANERFQGIKESAELGDKPFIDTLKASIQVQDRLVKLKEVELELKNKEAELNTFLWKDGFLPLELSSNTLPDELPISIPTEPLLNNETYDTLVDRHPDYLIGLNKIDQSKINYRLKREGLRPDLKLKYNALANNNSDLEYNVANYSWGASLSYPIFIRKERGKTKLAEIKMKDAQFAVHDKKALIRMKIEKAANNWSLGYQRAELQRQATTNYSQLLQSELTLFNSGESSLFLVNQRDLSWLDAQLKWAEHRFANTFGMLEFKLATQVW